ncbi:hypothetical protein H310_14136 [Aphanomyces invadans]|uniref:Ribosome quality control complex subunit 2 n=1 Tax=Aphanomyces invadans TaxID=157072 RepID=A0A024TCK3_9STRA|nr:hypothetical protein H310_14136 [Aphanomyces invadans]ETV91316.1 hypothetical protein H310_14136 [Aphanomyces invadans]|eukprot:XP_008880153.1 hypothetical protein H310_14136 [Aphanomyces invadans]
MKTRMAIDDISAMVGSIQKNVVNMRVTNIYDAEVNKTYILKLASPGLPKVFLLLQSGIRFHTTAYARETASALPLQFTMKLRKHLRGKRLASVVQCASDRVIDFCFGDGDQRHHLILELYAAGNIILTDHAYTILSLLRTHAYDDQVKVAVKQQYPIDNAMVVGNVAGGENLFSNGGDLILFIQQYMQDLASKEKSKKQYSLKQILMSKESGYGNFGPTIVEHCMVEAGIAPSLKIKTVTSHVHVPLTEADAQGLVDSLKSAPSLLEELSTNQVIIHGDQSDDTDTSRHGFIVLNENGHFDEFTPYLYAQHRGKPVQEFHTFDQAVDEYFSKIEAQAAEAEKKQAAQVAETKLDKLKKHQQEQMEAFRKTQEVAVAQAMLVEQNQQDIENVLLVIRSALASGMDWSDLEDLIKQEQHNGNPVATLIHKLDLAQNRVSVLLCDQEAEDEAVAHLVSIDLSLSALANARELYSKKKTAVKKAQKAIEATDKAIEQAAKKHDKKQAQQQLQRKTMYQRRKTMWFEKFHWFITREKYLVLAGKDAQQNETLVKRYLRKGDIFVHADLHGAATCIVRNRISDGSESIPVSALEQAGCMSVCRSKAWANQVVAGAYWVHADQVSKSAPTGEFLTTGSFMIRGKKNYIPAARLEMGLAIVFRIDESSVRNHIGDQGGNDDDDERDGDSGHAASRRQAEEPDDVEDFHAEASQIPDQVADVDAAFVDEMEAAKEIPAEVDEGESDKAMDVHDVVLEEEGDESKDVSEEFVDKPVGKKVLSAKERRDLKKKKKMANASDDVVSSEPFDVPTKAKGPAAPAPVRGKQGKLKKMKKKYADQDEDERLLRMAALGNVKPLQAAITKTTSEAVAAEENAADDIETNANDAASSVGGVVDEEKELFYKLQRERKAQLLEQEEEEAQNATFLESFTGNPLPNDILLFAMPMCAPYSTLELYTYKVKLTPGTQKKGKAVQFAVDHFLKLKPKPAALLASTVTNATSTTNEGEVAHNSPDGDPVEAQKELIKCVPESDLIGCIVGPVKVSAPGLNSAAMKKSASQKPKKAHKNTSTK